MLHSIPETMEEETGVMMKRWLLAAIVCSLVAAGCSRYQPITDLPEADGNEGQAGEPTKETEELRIDDADTLLPGKERVKVKGIYISGYMAGSEGFQTILEKIDGTEINAVVIDVKNDDGRITFSMDGVPVVTEIGASEKYIQDIDKLMAQLKERGLYTIARIVAFRDPYLAEKKPEWSLKNEDGSLYRDRQGLAWVNPYEQQVWDYLVDVGAEAARLGFDEIQFDYIRFSTDNTMKKVAFDDTMTKGRTRTDIITEFITYAYDQLSQENIFVSADVFGTIIGSKIDADAVGQIYSSMAEHLDYICPMIYPSHYGKGNFGIEYPDTKPYETVHAALLNSRHELAEGRSSGSRQAIVRPWLQDFTASYLENYIEYGPEEVRSQIQAVYDAGYDEWILWSASNKYTWAGLLTQEEAREEKLRIAESRDALPPETVQMIEEAAATGTAVTEEDENNLPEEREASTEDGNDVIETTAANGANETKETKAKKETRAKPNVVIVTTGAAQE